MADTTQVTVRIPTPLVEFADREVAGGRAKSRAAVIAQALLHEQRHLEEAREVEILKRLGGDPYPDLDEFHEAVWRTNPWADLD